MERFVWQDFKLSLPFEKVLNTLRIEEEEDVALIREKWEIVHELACPKVIVCDCPCEVKGDVVEIQGHLFSSPTLLKELTGIHRVFPYVVTCGTEIDDWSHEEEDPIVALWLDMIKGLVLEETRELFSTRMKERYGIKSFSSMAPGSGNLDTWPIEQQRPLFDLIADVKTDAGVTLTDKYLMLPTKSVSGILYPGEVDHITCQLCKRTNCVGRRAEYKGAHA